MRARVGDASCEASECDPESIAPSSDAPIAATGWDEEERSIECPICFDRAAEVRASCGHAFCRMCFSRAILASPRCASCRQVVRHVEPACCDVAGVVRTMKDEDEHGHLGITLGEGTRGAAILRLRARDLAAKHGFKVREEILGINGVPVDRHAHAICILQTLSDAQQRIECRVRPRPPSWCERWRRSWLRRQLYVSAIA